MLYLKKKWNHTAIFFQIILYIDYLKDKVKVDFKLKVIIFINNQNIIVHRL